MSKKLKNMNYVTTKKLILSLTVAGLVSVAFSSSVYAGCESTYGGGETCIINKRFEIEKKVIKLDNDEIDDWEDTAKDSDDWEDKVTNVEKGDFVVFKITIKNRSDDEADDFDDMKMEDFLPDELERIAGSGFTEYWDDFESGDSKTFYIAAEVNDDEYDRDESFKDCTVNEAKVEWDDNFEGSDTATVCWGNDEVTELPETGSNEMVSLLGISLIAIGTVIKKALNYIA